VAATVSGRIAILTYHSIDESGSVLSVSPHVFADQMRTLRGLSARVVSLDEIGAALAERRTGEDLVAITFDDGFRSVREHAWPVLAEHGFPATVFLVTDYCGSQNDWPGQPAWAPRGALLGWDEVREMAAGGVQFGSHTCTHPDLGRVSGTRAREEMASSRKAVEDAVGAPVTAFAYPYGTVDRTLRNLAAEEYAVAGSTELRFVGSDADVLALPRLDVHYLRRPMVFQGLLRPSVGGYLTVRRWLRQARRRLVEA
jgi:peptidoglycan/xylan/chitin deacetylase (PgdA/CDA1 family)